MVEIPESMDELVYFTRRTLGEKEEGNINVWVHRKKCPKCWKGLMGKPKDKKGKVRIRANEYVCYECCYRVEEGEYEDTLEAEAVYTCPKCKYQGETSIPFKRKKIKGADALKFVCEKCHEPIIVTKKMKELKK